MEHLAYTHLYLQYETPLKTPHFNSQNLKKLLRLSCLPICTATFMVETILPSFAVLSYGATGVAVTELQNQLKKLGHFPQNIPVTGYFGDITKTAVIQYQKANKLQPDGIVGATTATALGMTLSPISSPLATTVPLRLGSSGATVKQLQMELAALDYYKGSIDGFFNETTENAVVAFQREAYLETDGIVGPQTSKALQEIVKGI